MDVAQFKRELYQCKGTVYDLDGTLVRGRVAEGVGKRFLKRELTRIFTDWHNKGYHARNVKLGATNYSRVNRAAKEKGDPEGLRLFLEILGQARCADQESAYGFAHDYVQERALPGAHDFVRFIKYGMRTRRESHPSLVSTLGSDIAVEVAMRYFGLDNGIAAVRVAYNDGFISGGEVEARNGEEMAHKTEKVLQRYGLSLNACLVVGNDINDHPMMSAARLTAASPLADEVTKAAAHIWIRDYETFLEELRKSEVVS